MPDAEEQEAGGVPSSSQDAAPTMPAASVEGAAAAPAIAAATEGADEGEGAARGPSTDAEEVSAEAGAEAAVGSAEGKNEHDAAITVQRSARGYLVRRELEHQQKSAQRIQAVHRGKQVRKTVKAQHAGATKLQARVRGRSVRREQEIRNKSATRIQARQRGIWSRLALHRQRTAVRVREHEKRRVARRKLLEREHRDEVSRELESVKGAIEGAQADQKLREELEKQRLVLEAILLNDLKRRKIEQRDELRRKRADKVQAALMREIRNAKRSAKLAHLQHTNGRLRARAKLASKQLDVLILQAEAGKMSEERAMEKTAQYLQENGMTEDEGNREELVKLEAEEAKAFAMMAAAMQENKRLRAQCETTAMQNSSDEVRRAMEHSDALDRQLAALKSERLGLLGVVAGSQRDALNQLSRDCTEQVRIEKELKQELARLRNEAREARKEFQPSSAEPSRYAQTNGPTSARENALREQNKELAAALWHLKAAGQGLCSPAGAAHRSLKAAGSPRERRLVEQRRDHVHKSVHMLSRQNSMKRRHEKTVKQLRNKAHVTDTKVSRLELEAQRLRFALEEASARAAALRKRRARLEAVRRGKIEAARRNSATLPPETRIPLAP